MEKTSVAAALTAPAGVDPQWAEKVAAAKAAREQGRRLRLGRPATFTKR